MKIRVCLIDAAAAEKNIKIKQYTQKKRILQCCADPLYLIPSNPCNAILKYSSIGTRILTPLTWRTRCIRNAPCRCTAYAVSSFSAVSSNHPSAIRSSIYQQILIKGERPELHRLHSHPNQLEGKESQPVKFRFLSCLYLPCLSE